MKAWCDANKAGNESYLADGNASLSKSIGLTFDGSMYSLELDRNFCNGLEWFKRKIFIEKPEF